MKKISTIIKDKRGMRRVLPMLVAAIAMLYTLAGCNKWSDNGALDGMWQVLTIENLRSGKVTDVKDAQRYYCINLHVVSLTYCAPNTLKDFHMTGNLAYDRHSGSLDLDFPVRDYSKDKPHPDKVVTDQEVLDSLRPYGLYSIRTHLQVEKVNGSRLVMRSDSVLITCRRF